MSIEKSRQSLALGVVAAAIFVPLVGVVIYFALSEVGIITSPGEFNDAVEHKQAINCEITEPNGRKSLLQTNKDFHMVKLVIESTDGSKMKQHVLKAPNGVFIWSEDGSTAIKSQDDGFVDMMINDIDRNVAAGAALSCESPTMVSFTVPNYKFVEANPEGQ